MQEEYSAEQISAFKERLASLESELRSAIALAKEASKPVELDQSLQGRVSRGDARQQQEMAKAGLERNQLRLKKVLVALKRIENDDYGFCDTCDELISIERLQVMPESQYCIACQEKMD